MSYLVTAGSGDDIDTVWILCDVVSVSVPLPREHGLVLLREQAEPHREVSISVGIAEAAALKTAMEAGQGLRPSTHELFSGVLRYLRVDVVAARISRVTGESFQAQLVLMAEQGSCVADARPSDAMILAARQPVPAPMLVSDTSFA
jgi:bifunctional DNase/RNase